MSTLLIKNAYVLVTMDDQRREISDGALFVRDNVIESVGTSADLLRLSDSADRTQRVQLAVEACCSRFSSRLLFVATGQSACGRPAPDDQ